MTIKKVYELLSEIQDDLANMESETDEIIDLYNKIEKEKKKLNYTNTIIERRHQ